MTKKELLKQINYIANEVSDLQTSLADLTKDATRIERLLEELPSEEDEIEDDVKIEE